MAWMLCCPWAAGVAGEMGKSPKDSELFLPLSWPWEPVPGADTSGGTTTVGRTLAALAGEGLMLWKPHSHLQVSPEHLSGEEA